MYKILFVCTGNICRSPTAEAVFRNRLLTAGLGGRVTCDSAGTHGYHIGEAPDPRTIAFAQRRGVDMTMLSARKVSLKDYEEFDLLLAMDSGHLRFLQRMKPEGARAQVALYLAYSGVDMAVDVPDPYYEKDDAFDHVLDLVEAASDNLVRLLREKV